jgi:predicted NBD/HSP70 family sugar kinase
VTTDTLPLSPSSPGSVLALVRAGAASRADVARLAALSPTTVAARVESLVRAGYLREAGDGPSRGGRRPRRLEVSPELGVVVGVDLGVQHATFGLVDAAGTLLARRDVAAAVSDGPDAVLDAVVREIEALRAEHAPDVPLLAACVGVPGPVDARTGRVVSPARMPGWNGTDVAGVLAPRLGVPVIVENDANLMALGEHAGSGFDVEHLVFVKVGSGIGCGVVASGALHRGAQGFAGDISHASVPDAPPVPCSCGRAGCLDAVASGAALVRQLQEAGAPVQGIDDLVALARDAHPEATNLLREAGARTGAVLSTIINFFNPDRLVVGGQLAEADAFVAGVRSAVYARCLPMVTDHLDVRSTRVGREAGIRGAARTALDHVLAPGAVDAALR